jgi:ribosomal protein L25 (general stress protein Ctc)
VASVGVVDERGVVCRWGVVLEEFCEAAKRERNFEARELEPGLCWVREVMWRKKGRGVFSSCCVARIPGTRSFKEWYFCQNCRVLGNPAPTPSLRPQKKMMNLGVTLRLCRRITPRTFSTNSSPVPIASLSPKFRQKFNIDYTKPLPAASKVRLGGPIYTNTPTTGLAFELRQTELQETKLGSKGSTRLRRGGYLPCLIYGGGPLEDNPDVSVTIPTKEIETLVRKYGSRLENTVFQLTIAEYPGQQILAVPRQLHTHPVSDEIITMNFLRLMGNNANKKKFNHLVKVDIPIEYVDHDLSPAIKRGGFVNRTRWKLPCRVNPDVLIGTANGEETHWEATNDSGYDSKSGLTTTNITLMDDIPQYFEVSVKGFEVRDRVRVSNIGMGPGIEPHPTKAKHDHIVGNVRGKTVVSMAEGGDIDESEIAF